MSNKQTRRAFLAQSSVLGLGAAITPYIFTSAAKAEVGEKLTTAAIGVGGRGTGIGLQLRRSSNMVACCDVDAGHARKFSEWRDNKGNGKSLEIFEDYRKILDRKDIQAVTIGTPDHWHTKIVHDALHAGKDVYCEKPLTLTVDESKLLVKDVKDTGRILQVGTQQRTENNHDFLKAVAIAQSGRLGKIKKVTAMIGGAPKGGPFKKEAPPAELNWDMWLGQAPKVDYIRQRCHGEFRWWFEYSGGKLTDWGAHHVDIAQWAIGQNGEKQGPKSIEVVSVNLPVKFEKGYPTVDDSYNTAVHFQVRCMFPNDVEMLIQNGPDNGILIEGEKGRIFVNRGSLRGEPVDQIKADKADMDKLQAEVVALFNGRKPKGHMDNFLDAVADRKQPMSDVFTHTNALNTCHLANIAMRLDRKINWDPATQLAVGDDEINEKWLRREQRKGYEIS